MNSILISGAGLAGICFARQLKKHGIAYTLIEKSRLWISSALVLHYRLMQCERCVIWVFLRPWIICIK